MTVSNNKVVSVFYHAKNETGDVVDSNETFAPLEYLHGYNNILAGLEKEMEGMVTGEERTIILKPAQAYGEYDPQLLLEVEHEQVGDNEHQLQSGAVVESAEGKEFVVSRVNEDTITLDSNHPLAGLTLEFNLKVAAVRDASAEELQQGYSKLNNDSSCGPGCCC